MTPTMVQGGVIDFQRSPDDVGIAAEVALPEAGSSEQQRSDAVLRIGWLEVATEKRAHAKESPGILCEIDARDVFGECAAGDLHVRVFEAEKRVDRRREAQVVKLCHGGDGLKYRTELERFYRKDFGNAKKYQAALNKRIADRFQASKYVPKLLDQPAPVLEFTTLKGEKFDSKELSGKTVVLNLWSTG